MTLPRGKIKNVEIISPEKIQDALQKCIDMPEEAYKRNPSNKNFDTLEARKRDLENAKRDNECLIKGCGIPVDDYLKDITKKEVGLE